MVIKFLGSYPDYSLCPKSKYPEYAFWGRSNVGKSSLINALLSNNKLAKVSGTPGKTRHINLFDIDNKWLIADLPGYGYAKTSLKNRQAFIVMTTNYLLYRQNLTLVFLLIDIKLSPQKNDLEQINWLGVNKIPFSIIFTKTDKLSLSQLKKNKEKYQKELKKAWENLPNMFFTSSLKKKGIEPLYDNIITLNNITN